MVTARLSTRTNIYGVTHRKTFDLCWCLFAVKLPLIFQTTWTIKLNINKHTFVLKYEILRKIFDHKIIPNLGSQFNIPVECTVCISGMAETPAMPGIPATSAADAVAIHQWQSTSPATLPATPIYLYYSLLYYRVQSPDVVPLSFLFKYTNVIWHNVIPKVFPGDMI